MPLDLLPFIDMRAGDTSVLFQKQFNGTTKVTKAKSSEAVTREFKTIQSLISLKKNHLLQDSNILPVKTAVDSYKSIIYTLDIPKHITLREYISSEAKPLNEDFIIKCVRSLVKISKLLGVIVGSFVTVSPERILIVGDKIVFSLFAFEDENPIYDPEHAGVSLDRAPVWSIAMLVDELFRGHLRTEEFTPIPNISNPNIDVFLNEVLLKMKPLQLDDVEPYLSSGSQTLLCPTHKQLCHKVDLKEKKLVCPRCIQHQYYNVEIQQHRCRQKMDEMIELYKTIEGKFSTLIQLTKGEDLVDIEVLKKLMQESLEEFQREYSSFTSTLETNNVNPFEQQSELEKMAETLESHKEELILKYQKKIKKHILDAFRNCIDN